MLQNFKSDVFSQSGEDGLVREILSRISSLFELDMWCVEFGAWDGIHMSNTCNLIRNAGYRAVLIEGDSERCIELKKNHPSENVVKINRFIHFEGECSLDAVLGRTAISKDFDFLSIDVDGCDYHIFDSLNEFRPKVVCIEFNPEIPNAVDYVQPKNFSVKHGSSAAALVRLASEKKYSLVAATDTNLIFVTDEIKGAVIGSDEIQLDALVDDIRVRNYVFPGYDGTIITSRPIRLPFHRIDVPAESIQILPKYLRTFYGDYSGWQRFIFAIFLIRKSPRRVFNAIQRAIGLG